MAQSKGCIGCAAVFLAGFFGLMFLMVIAYIRAPARPGDSSLSSRTKLDAYAMAQTFVDKRLISPSSAEYPSMRDPTVKVQKVEGQWYIAGYVDSDNALGASIRTRYNVVMQQLPGNQWKLIDIEIE